MLEGSDAGTSITTPASALQLTRCLLACHRAAQNQLDALKPIADAHEKIEEAKLETAAPARAVGCSPLFYAHRHLALRRTEAIEL